MTRTTQQLRVLWAPACEGPWARLELYGAGVVSVDPLIVPAVKALDACLRAANYGSDREDTGAYNCRPITGGTIDPATGQIRKSLHAYGIAIDLNWQENPYGPVLRTDMPPAMIRAIEAIRTNDGVTVWRWGGRYKGNKDAMHFEVVASPAELAAGIDPSTVPGGKPATNPTTPTEEFTMSEAQAIKDQLAHLQGTVDKLALGLYVEDVADDKDVETVGQAVKRAASVAGVAAGYAKANALAGLSPEGTKYVKALAAFYDPSTTKPKGATAPVPSSDVAAELARSVADPAPAKTAPVAKKAAPQAADAAPKS